ncbi:membrane protein [Nocardioides psychrotolerans]|uniref:DUF456 domain-containing protein n=1 Tax=Nocardioides psychrotolerans TaxID=1005945 RepID=A0A1I3FQJ4_9ACTN|nr:DUF456 domain-containing protein [Nocardioides psychrotolerans]GEP37255.1 membrane protein [Nocardioides psychrotolerans]SFI13397.1 hypothetical protein SAMN05216561_10598 [Nocardioides psychrotolerans]
MSLTEVLVAVALAVGLAGILVPLLPGSALIFAAVLAWAITIGTAGGWAVLTIATALLLVGTVVKYAVPGKHLKDAGIPASTQWIGAGTAIVGFFVVPVVGIVIGFVLGVYLAEHRRVGPAQAWPSTKHALRAVGLSILIELTAGLLATLTWVVGVVAT